MDLKNKKYKKMLLSMKLDINRIHFKLKHKNLEKVKNEVVRRGKIFFCKGRLFSPYILALGISLSTFSFFGTTPFILDKEKKYQKIMKEIDDSEHTRIIKQYDDFESNENVLTLYDKWQKKGNTYFRNIKIYKLTNLDENKILQLLTEDINNLEDVFGRTISEKIEERNYINKEELEKDAYVSARIYSENKDEFIYVNQSVEKNIIETILWIIVLIMLETGAFFYRCFSSFSYSKMVKKINNLYSIDKCEMLEKRLRILETSYCILSKYSNVIDNSIFSNYLNFKKNIDFSKLNKDELSNVLIIAMENKLLLRDKLSFDELYTYGVEIELENVKIKKIAKKFSKFSSLNWSLVRDCSLYKGIEFVSPILYDSKNYWNQLYDVCETTNNLAVIDKHCGLHVHVGSHILGKDKRAWLNFLKLYAVYENIIFRFAYGEFYNYRDSIIDYAPPVSLELWKDYLYLKEKGADLSEIIFTIKHGKYNAINFDHVKYDTVDQVIEDNTVEIRCGNGCKNPAIIQNYVNFLLSLFRYAKSDKFNDELIDKRYDKCKYIYGNIDMYCEIYLEQALELIDEIFYNNLDKIYFLNQYLKDFKADKKKFDKNKTFTKK